jgi:zinc/manganese transport system permease protein/iron/zinc/copper transport system permease protein
MDMLALYKWTLIGGALAGGALTLIGAQLAARNQAVQALVVSQAASFGVIVALMLRPFFEAPHSHFSDVLPLLSGSLSSAVFYVVCEVMAKRRWPSVNTHFIGLFALLMAAGYTLVALVPTLETHMTAAYFGDLTVATDDETLLIACLSALVLVFLLWQWRRLSDWSFQTVTFGQLIPSPAERRVQAGFLAAGMVMISASVHFLGLLFTLACLFLPILVLSKMQSGLKGLALRLLAGAMGGVAMGFIVSLWQGNLPTVPSIALALLLSSFLAGFIPA